VSSSEFCDRRGDRKRRDAQRSVTPQIEARVFQPEETADIHIEIADNGPGIPSAEWEIITVGEETPLVHSSGIGLWLIYWAASSN